MIMTHDFRDSDGDGIDDRKQSGPGVVPDWIKNRPPIGGRKPAPPRREGPKFGDRNDPRRDRLEKALQDRKRRDLLRGKRPPINISKPDEPRPFPSKPIGGTPKPPRRGTVKGSRPRPPMPSPKPPMGGGRPPMFGGGRPKPPRRGGTIGGTIGAIGGAIGGRPPMFGGGRPKPPRRGRTVKGSRPRPPMPSPKPPGRVPITLGGIR